MNSKEIIKFIETCNDMPALREINAAMREAFDRQIRKASRGFDPGDRVRFTVSKGMYAGMTFEGIVERVNAKSVKVRVMQNGRGVVWRVGPPLLTKVA